MPATLTVDDDTFAALETEARQHGESVTEYLSATVRRHSKAEEIARYGSAAPLAPYGNYLYRVVSQGETAPDAAERMLRFLRRLLSDVPDAPLPKMSAAERQVICVWDAGEHHLELEVFGGGAGEWLYRNRTAGAVWEEDWSLETPVSDEARHYLGRVRG